MPWRRLSLALAPFSSQKFHEDQKDPLGSGLWPGRRNSLALATIARSQGMGERAITRTSRERLGVSAWECPGAPMGGPGEPKSAQERAGASRRSHQDLVGAVSGW